MITRFITRAWTALAVPLLLAAASLAQEPMDLGEETVLFADDFVIEKMNGVTLEPVRHTRPFGVEKPAPPLANSTVLYDDKAKVFRMTGIQGETKAFFESKDGLNWIASERVPEDATWRKQVEALTSSKRIGRVIRAADGERYVAYVADERDGLRTISRTTSKDLVTWTKPEPLDINLPGENLLPGWFHEDPNRIPRVIGYAVRVGKDGKGGDIVLISSHDGKKFDRTFRDAVIRPGTNKEAWEDPKFATPGVLSNVRKPRKYTFMGAMAVYAGSDRCFVLPSNRFASLHAGAEEGEVILKPIVCSGNHLRLNFSTSADGYIKVEFQTLEGEPIAPYTLANAKRKTDDRPHVAEWQTKTPTRFNDMKGKTIRIRMVMKEADLYSMQFANRD